jgi:hypothetical protein
MYNIISCAGFEAAEGFFTTGGCMAARLGIVILFFVIAMIRKWGAEEWGIPFNFFAGLIGGLVSYFIVVTITGGFKFAFLIGLIVSVALGYGSGYIFGGSDDD